MPAAKRLPFTGRNALCANNRAKRDKCHTLYATDESYCLCGYTLLPTGESKSLGGCSLNRNAIKLKSKVGGYTLDHRRNMRQQLRSLCHYGYVDIAYYIASCRQ